MDTSAARGAERTGVSRHVGSSAAGGAGNARVGSRGSTQAKRHGGGRRTVASEERSGSSADRSRTHVGHTNLLHSDLERERQAARNTKNEVVGKVSVAQGGRTSSLHLEVLLHTR